MGTIDEKKAMMIDQIRKVVEEEGLKGYGQWKTLAGMLNERNITTMRGNKRWTPENLRAFCEANIPEISIAASYAKTIMPISMRRVPRTALIGPQLDAKDIRALNEILQWWREGGGKEETSEITSRPRFRGESVSCRIRVNKRLRDAAWAKSRMNRKNLKTSGSLTGLVEYLMWEYLGFDGQE
jgi:hypothetical protein